MKSSLLSIQNLKIHHQKANKEIVQDVNLDIAMGEIVGLIGESGSGKSLTARAIMGLLPLNMKASGNILFQNQNLLSLSSNDHRRLLGCEIGMIFQDYRGSFTPYIKIGKQMIETIRTHLSVKRKDAKRIAYEVLAEMGLDSDRVFRSYSFQLSGGQIQRASIAMILALKPALIICDEITTALDVMNGEKVLDYIDRVRKNTGCAILMITHDLIQAYKRTDRIYVIHQGEIVEEGFPEQIRCHHQHTYTKELCSCILALPEDKTGQKERVKLG